MFPKEYLTLPSPDKTCTNRELVVRAALERAVGIPATTDQGRKSQLAAVRAHGLSAAEIERLKNSPFRILAVTGDSDILLPPEHSYKMPRQIGAKVFIIKGGGHGICMQTHQLVNDVIRQHIEAPDAKPEPTTTILVPAPPGTDPVPAPAPEPAQVDHVGASTEAVPVAEPSPVAASV